MVVLDIPLALYLVKSLPLPLQNLKYKHLLNNNPQKELFYTCSYSYEKQFKSTFYLCYFLIIFLISGKRLKNVVLLGDFNTYNDFEAPMDLITFKPGHAMTHCKQELQQIGNRYINFDDSWQKLHGKDHTGLTFSNMVTIQ